MSFGATVKKLRMMWENITTIPRNNYLRLINEGPSRGLLGDISHAQFVSRYRLVGQVSLEIPRLVGSPRSALPVLAPPTRRSRHHAR